MLSMTLPPEVRAVCDRLHAAGFHTVVAGGAVRDSLRCQMPHDYDLATAATTGQVRAALPGVEFYAKPAGEDHGSAVAILDGGRQVEITTFRRDVECDGRHAKVEFASRAEDDLARRDFTVNALAWDPETGKLYGPDNGDPAGALNDIRERIVRFVGDPLERMRQDYTRILRAPYMEVKLGGRLDPASDRAVNHAVRDLGWWRNIKMEAAHDLLFKCLGQSAGGALRRWDDLGLVDAFFPEVERVKRLLQNVHHDPDAFQGDNRLRTTVWEHTLRAVHLAQAPEAPFPFAGVPYLQAIGLDGRAASLAMLRLAILWHDVGKADIWGSTTHPLRCAKAGGLKA